MLFTKLIPDAKNIIPKTPNIMSAFVVFNSPDGLENNTTVYTISPIPKKKGLIQNTFQIHNRFLKVYDQQNILSH